MEPDVPRRWRFYVEDFDGEIEYVGASGLCVDIDDETSWFTGTMEEAAKEADRRADFWEEGCDCLAARVVYESLGKV